MGESQIALTEVGDVI